MDDMTAVLRYCTSMLDKCYAYARPTRASICVYKVQTTPLILKGPAVIEQQYIGPIPFLIPVVSHTLCINYPSNCINAMLWATF